MTPDTVRAWISGCGGRRFLLCVGSGIVNTVLLILGYLDKSTFQTLILGTLGAFIAGNSWEHHGNGPDGEVKH